jgi:hypothetical protein
MRRIWYCIVLLLILPSCKSQKLDNSTYSYKNIITRQTLENYLSHSITMSEFLVNDSFLTDDSVYHDKKADINLLEKLNAKFIGRSIYRWGNEQDFNNPQFLGNAQKLIERIHRYDNNVIFQAAVFEAVSRKGVNSIKIPEWTYQALGLPVEDRHFSYENMIDSKGKYVNLWGKDLSVPDITHVETQLWFMYLIGSYVRIGIEAIHLGQVTLIGMNDKGFQTWNSFMKKVRAYVNPISRRKFVMFDAHTPGGGVVVDGVSMLDFNSFPLRIKEVKDKFMSAKLEVGNGDAIYKRSKSCTTPSGWSCESLPYLVEFDNFGISNHPGVAKGDIYVWGYDEISWLFKLNREDRNKWLIYADKWLKENDKNGHLEMPGRRVVTLEGSRTTFRAINPTEDCPNGTGLESVIKEIWK